MTTPWADPRAAVVETAVSAAPPGADPDALRRAAAALAGLGSDLDSALRSLRADQHVCLWRGTAGDAFRHLLDDAPKHLDRVGTRYRSYALALSAHATGIEDVRLRFRLAQNTLRTARDDAAARAAAHPVGSPPAPESTDAVGSALRAVQDLQDEAVVHARRCSNALHHITDSDGLHNPHGARHLAHDLAAVAGGISKYSGIIGIVAVFALPELAPLLFAVSALASAAELGVDAADKATGDGSVSWTDLGMDGLGALPIGGLGSSARAGAGALGEAVRTARSAEDGAHGAFLALGLGRELAVKAVTDSVRDLPGSARAAGQRIGAHGARGAIGEQWLPRVSTQARRSAVDIATSADGAADNPVQRRVINPSATVRAGIRTWRGLPGPVRIPLGAAP